jgi:hypothetical protein
MPSAAAYEGGNGQDGRPGLANPMGSFGSGFGADTGGPSRPLMDPSIVSASTVGFGGPGAGAGFGFGR